MELFLAAALLFLESLLLLRALRQRAALRSLVPNETAARADAVAVEVIVPARNEAPNIRECLESLVVQTYSPGKLRIIVVDDDSEDGTDEIIAAFATGHSGVRCLRSGPLQAGWTGKTQACWRGAAAAFPDAEWLAFIDADMRAEPSLIASAVAEAERGLGLLSLAPKHTLVSFAERLMIPCGLYLLGFRQDLVKIRSRCGEANVAGQFMLIRRSAYQQVGGHAAVAAAICEDLELARLLERSGFSIALMDGSRLLSSRMYSGWATLWPGFAKNVLDMFGGVHSTLTTAAVAVVLSWSLVILPVACRRGARRRRRGSRSPLAAAVDRRGERGRSFDVADAVRGASPCGTACCFLSHTHWAGPSPWMAFAVASRAVCPGRAASIHERAPRASIGDRSLRGDRCRGRSAHRLRGHRLLLLIRVVLLPFVFSAVTAFVLTSFIDWLAKTTRAPRNVIALAIFFVLLGLIGFGAYLAIPGLLGGLASAGVDRAAARESARERPVQILGRPVSAPQHPPPPLRR